MTSEHTRRSRRLEDGLYVDALLAEAGFDARSADDDGLRDALLRLRSFRTTEVPVPCAELAALMDGAEPGFAKVIPLAGRTRKRPRKKQAALTSLAVAASLGIAGGAAAGNETVRRHAEGTIDTIVRSFSPPVRTPAQAPAPAPAQPAEIPDPAPDAVPSPAAVLPPGTSAPDVTPGHIGTPGGAGAGSGKEPSAEAEYVPGRAAAPSPRAQEADGIRKPSSGTAPGTPGQPGTPPAAAVPPAAADVPEPKVSRGTSPR
ncbi:hypothetical protein ACIQCN_10545 [Pseudarthrobacter sp. NPDC092424]|uniref:hypothetical protein n=1 Tax=Pseudarthrobacter sp. NPDC092424 TaxID=3364415 RepID=UPI003819BE7C